jgi:hypothetical protein
MTLSNTNIIVGNKTINTGIPYVMEGNFFNVMVSECTCTLSAKTFFGGGKKRIFPDLTFKFMISQIQYKYSFKTAICILCYTDKYYK